MKISGIICEYNPFHNGHLYHINETRKNGATHIVAVMSGNFVQGGDAAIADKWARTRLALEGGADLSGDAAVFGGTAATVLSTVDTLDLSPYSVVTVEFFAKVTNTPHRVYFLEHTESMNANIGGFHINLNERDAGEYRIGALMKTTSAELGIACVDTAEGPLQDGKWHHVAVVLKCNKTTSYRAADPADWCISVWVDGAVVQRSGHRMDTLANTNPSCTFRNAKLYLGSRANSEGFLTGEIDDVRITAGSLAPNDFLKKRTALPGTTAILR